MMKFWRSLLNPLLIFLVFTIGGTAVAQQSSQLKMANLFKRSGKYEQALELYLQVYRSGKVTPVLVRNIQDCYESLKRYDEMIAFFQKLITRFPTNIEYRIKLGRAYFLAGQRQKAFELWDRLLEKHKKNVYLYRSLGANLIDLRLFDRAIRVYQMAIENVPRQFSLYREIALIYRAQLNYAAALENYLHYYQHFPNQFGYIRSQIIAMTSDTAAIPQMIGVLQTYRKSHRQLLGIDDLLADMYLRQKDFERAFQVYLDLYHHTGETNYLFRFVTKAADNEAYAYAVQGLQMLVKVEKKQNRKHQFRLELARNYYRWARQEFMAGHANKGQQLLKKAQQTARAIIDEKPASPYRWAAYDLLGDIALYFREDLDKAIRYYQKALQARIDVRYKDRIRLKLTRCFLMQGHLKKAAATLAHIQSRDYQSLAQFRQAELLFFQGRLQQARKAFERLDKTLAADDSLKNNVLDYALLLTLAGQDSAGLVRFARAKLLVRQKKLSEAAELFEALAKSNSPLSMKSGEQAVSLLIRLGKYERAKALLRTLSAKSSGYADGDRLYFLLARAQEKEHLWKEAFATYQQLLTQFPDSFYLEQAREKARWIKENKLKAQVK